MRRRAIDLVRIATVMAMIAAAKFGPAQSYTLGQLDSDVKPT